MSLINKIPRLLRVLIVAAILAILVWRLAAGTDYVYHGIAAAVIVLLGVTFVVYSSSRSITKDLAKKAELASYIRERLEAEKAKEIPESEIVLGEVSLGGTRYPEPTKSESKPVAGRRSIDNLISFRAEPPPRKDAKEVAAKYFQMAQKVNAAEQSTGVTPVAVPAPPHIDTAPVTQVENKVIESTPAVKETGSGKPATALREDETTLTDEEKNELVNSVWSSCENPYCKFTRFLDVHHVIDEKDGGTNKLDNLIVLCSFCHDLAHRNEIPEEEMRTWIASREGRFQFKPNWHYH